MGMHLCFEVMFEMTEANARRVPKCGKRRVFLERESHPTVHAGPMHAHVPALRITPRRDVDANRICS
jgi:hypothetical protein